jgi:hypothetical protein
MKRLSKGRIVFFGLGERHNWDPKTLFVVDAEGVFHRDLHARFV